MESIGPELGPNELLGKIKKIGNLVVDFVVSRFLTVGKQDVKYSSFRVVEADAANDSRKLTR